MRAFRLAYDGTDYRGFQRQPHNETVEDAVFAALDALDIEFQDGAPVGYSAAGRTDAGVSARAQTVAFGAPDWLTPRAFNAELPTAVRAWAAADAPEDFHATHDAESRAYRYFRYAPDADDDRAAAACERLAGRHDFHNYTTDETGTIRDLELSIDRDEAFLVLDCRAGGFARRMVRRLVSAVDSVAHGRRDLQFLDRTLGEEPLDGPEGIASAAPEPLVLDDVTYPSLEFRVNEAAAESARDVFAGRRRDRLAGARVAGHVAAVDR